MAYLFVDFDSKSIKLHVIFSYCQQKIFGQLNFCQLLHLLFFATETRRSKNFANFHKNFRIFKKELLSRVSIKARGLIPSLFEHVFLFNFQPTLMHIYIKPPGYFTLSKSLWSEAGSKTKDISPSKAERLVLSFFNSNEI